MLSVYQVPSKIHYRGSIDRGHLTALGANGASLGQEDICRLALWCFVLYKAHNHIRTRSGGSLSSDEIKHLFDHFLVGAIAGHPDACRLIEHGWRQDFRFQECEELTDSD